ncbi:MAG: hypothetical protein MZV63_43990 [Marinilabiliales bacterium]|nr:hypothetical protein [Marinilabiliales bacterium]
MNYLHYIFPEFTPGTILMKSGRQYEASLNYSTLSEEMIFEDQGKKLAIGKEDKRAGRHCLHHEQKVLCIEWQIC